MSWAQIADLLPHHRKILRAGRNARAVFGLYVASICYAQRHLPDGHLPSAALALLLPSAGRPRVREIKNMIALGLWDDKSGELWIHDYLDHNDSAKTIQARRNAQTARKWRQRHGGTGPARHAGHEPVSRGDSPTLSRDPSSPLLSTPLLSTPLLSTPSSKNPRKDSLSGTLRPTAIRVLKFLNDQAGKRFEPVPANLTLILARLKDGATEQNCRGVIFRKCREWKDDLQMAKYLRPKTLFSATNFAQYVGERTGERADHADAET
jgi:uncharacterized phage protein (TIGR02220 family)